jgi:rhamnogalacturonan endolyase
MNAQSSKRNKRTNTITIRKMDLTECPEGDILEVRKPDAAVDAFFKDWEASLTGGGRRRTLLRVIHETGGSAIEHAIEVDGQMVGPWEREECLLTGDPLWRDYVVEAGLTLDSSDATYSADNYYVNIRPMSGLVARMTDLRHYYFFALEVPGSGRLVLYRRSDDDWHVLAEKKLIIVDHRYYNLRMQLQGDKITCGCNGEETFSIVDYSFQRGRTGVRFNTKSRVKDLQVSMTPGELNWLETAETVYAAEIEELSNRYPSPVLYRTLDLRKYWPFKARVVTLDKDGAKGFLLESDKLVLVDMDGKVIWERELKGYWPVTGEVHSGDSFDIFGTVGHKLTSLDGATGSILKQIDLPRLGASNTVGQWYDAPANLGGNSVARDFLIRENSHGGGGTILWAYDNNLNLLWKVDDVYPMYGHVHSFAYLDVNSDGRDEVYAGTSLYSADGKLLMKADAADEIAATLSYGVHVDAIVAGNFSDDPDLDPVIAACGGSAGFFVINGITGETLSVHKTGHAQGCYAGNFHPELPGLSVVAGTRWENFGILTYFSGRGDRLLSFQPDTISQGGPPVNWTGDGQEFVLISSSPKALGMYDGKGRKVVRFPDELKSTQSGVMVADVTGDPRDELIFLVDGELRIYTQDRAVNLKRIYQPRRAPMASYPGWKEIDDLEKEKL